MSSEKTFLLVTVIIAAITVIVIQLSMNRHRIKRAILDGLIRRLEVWRHRPQEPEQPAIENGPRVLTAEEKSKAELERLQEIIEDRKQIARDTDISHHLWSFYKNHFLNASPQSVNSIHQQGRWYGIKMLQASNENNVNSFDFELNGAGYRFMDDEEKHGWSDNVKIFGLFLYDSSGQCLIEIPVKVKIDKKGREYSIPTGGPKAFLPGDWINDFINTKLMHQRLHNQEIRAEKHLERLSEIEELKDRFGISD